MAATFWQALDGLVAGSRIIIDRPRHSAHPRYPEVIYPLDYGYLAGTVAMDGGGIDVWVGAEGNTQVTGLMTIVDLIKRDAEIKLLLNCSPEAIDTVQTFTETVLYLPCLVMRR